MKKAALFILAFVACATPALAHKHHHDGWGRPSDSFYYKPPRVFIQPLGIVPQRYYYPPTQYVTPQYVPPTRVIVTRDVEYSNAPFMFEGRSYQRLYTANRQLAALFTRDGDQRYLVDCLSPRWQSETDACAEATRLR